MATTLLNAMIELSKQLGDDWSGTTTSAGAVDGTTLVDTALKAKANDWVETGEGQAYDFLTEEPTSNADIYEERLIRNLDNSIGTLTVLAHGGQIESGIDYQIHRLFSPSDKRSALLYAARHGFPNIFEEIWNEELVCGNWLRDGSFERWTTSTNPTDWTVDTVTATQTTSSPYYKHGSTSVKLDTAAGKITQSITDFDDLKYLAGKSVTFTIQGWCDTASCLRIAVYDGSTRTYSSYHDGDSAWTQDNPRNDDMYVTVQIDDNPTEVTFEIYHDVAAGTSYADDARVISDYRGRLYIGHLGLARNRPHSVYIEPSYYSQEEDWIKVRDYKVDKNGYLYIPTTYPSDYRLRIRGMGYLDFLASGASSTAWTATINIDSPQLDILVAEAALYLYGIMALPNFDTGKRKEFANAYSFWKMKLTEAQDKYAMVAPPMTVNWGVH
jgi:hypothetical protein